jgi:kynurenine 3-monooxygenase
VAKRNVAIVGAGLVGSLLAVCLRDRGYNVDLFEKREDPRLEGADGGRSINLVITSRGIHGLKQAGLHKEAMDISIPVYGRMIHSLDGKQSFQPYGRDQECNHSISRGGFNKLLISAAEKRGARLHFDHSLESIDFKNKILKFSSSDQKYDLLFGADGAGSRVRKALAKNFPDGFKETTEWLEADYKELLMPASSGKHPLQKDALHIWPRGSHMLMGLANGDGSFTMTLYLRKEGPKSFSEVKTEKQIQDLFQSEFSDAVPLMPNYLEEFKNHPQGALGTVRCSQWVLDDSVALIGDAAHAIVPFFGQGMNCGFEDCTFLLGLMEKHGEDWAKILAAYHEERKPNADAIADMAQENWVEMRDKVAQASFQLRKKVEAWLEEQFPKYYKTRYRMITYTLVPYAVAQEAGIIHDRILGKLCAGISSPSEIPMEKARALIESELLPFVKTHGLA